MDQFCRLLDGGMSIDEAIQRLGLSEQGFVDLYDVYSSDEYHDFLEKNRAAGIDTAPDLSFTADYDCEMMWRKLVDPLTLLDDSDVDGLLMSVETLEYDGITERVYRLGEASLSESLTGIEYIDPREGYARYLNDREQGITASLVADPYLTFKARWLLCEKYSLTPIHGHETGIRGRIYAETWLPDETGDRKHPYLYYSCDNEVAEFTVESNPQLVIGRISDEELKKVQRWIEINIDALQRHWYDETGSFELIEELLDLNGKHIYIPKKR